MTDFAHAQNVRCPDCGFTFCPEEGSDCPECETRRRQAFERWLDDFVESLVDAGMSREMAEKHRERYRHDAKNYFDRHINDGKAFSRELTD